MTQIKAEEIDPALAQDHPGGEDQVISEDKEAEANLYPIDKEEEIHAVGVLKESWTIAREEDHLIVRIGDEALLTGMMIDIRKDHCHMVSHFLVL